MMLLYWGGDAVWAMVALGVILVLAVILGIQAHRMRVLGGNEELPGLRGEVTQASNARGYAHASVRGEIWRVHAAVPLAPGDIVRVRAARGLTLEVERLDSATAAGPAPTPTQQGENP